MKLLRSSGLSLLIAVLSGGASLAQHDIREPRPESCPPDCSAPVHTAPPVSPPPPDCPPVVAAIAPKYYVLGIIYSPPGCSTVNLTGGGTLRCSETSSVVYQNGSSLGSKVSVDHFFSNGVSVTNDVGGGFSLNGYLKLSHEHNETFSGGQSLNDVHSETVTKSETITESAKGNSDGVDPLQDIFLLWLNPAVVIEQKYAAAGNSCNTTSSSSINWYMAMAAKEVPTEILFSMPAAWLKYSTPDPNNLSSMPQPVSDQFAKLGFTQDDYKAILALDPFANSSDPNAPDYKSILLSPSDVSGGESLFGSLGSTITRAFTPRRFIPTTHSFGYTRPVQSKDCADGVCSCIALGDTIKNELQILDQQEVTTSLEWKGGDKITGEISVGNMSGDNQHQGSWKITSTTASTTDKSQSATATIHCPSINYSGPLEMQIWWDTLYGTFVFVPATLDGQLPTLHQAQVVDSSGEPLRNEPIALMVGGKAFHAVTDSSGHYAIRALENFANAKQSPTAQVIVRGAKKDVSLTPAVPAEVVRLP
jgi:hypothetical protein